MNKELSCIYKAIKDIIETTLYFDWKYKQVWVQDNCIYAEAIKKNGNIETEGLYAGSNTDTQAVYNVYSKLIYMLNLNDLLVNDDDDILI